MTRKALARFGAMALGALSMVALGRIWAWYVFGSDPAPWAIAAPSLLAVGVLASFLPSFPRVSSVLLTAAVGLYGGWLIRALLLGNLQVGPGAEFLVAGMVVGAAAGIRWTAGPESARRRGLLGGLYGVILGGFIIGPILSSLVFGELHSPVVGLSSAVACGAVGLFVGANMGRAEKGPAG
jgi:hypothetical protein